MCICTYICRELYGGIDRERDRLLRRAAIPIREDFPAVQTASQPDGQSASQASQPVQPQSAGLAVCTAGKSSRNHKKN